MHRKLDRSHIDIGGSFNFDFGTITYENKTYGNSDEHKVEFESILDDNLNWDSYSFDNFCFLQVKRNILRHTLIYLLM